MPEEVLGYIRGDGPVPLAVTDPETEGPEAPDPEALVARRPKKAEAANVALPERRCPKAKLPSAVAEVRKVGRVGRVAASEVAGLPGGNRALPTVRVGAGPSRSLPPRRTCPKEFRRSILLWDVKAGGGGGQ